MLVKVKHWKGIRKKDVWGECPTNNMDECDPKWAFWMVRKIGRLKRNFQLLCLISLHGLKHLAMLTAFK